MEWTHLGLVYFEEMMFMHQHCFEDLQNCLIFLTELIKKYKTLQSSEVAAFLVQKMNQLVTSIIDSKPSD